MARLPKFAKRRQTGQTAGRPALAGLGSIWRWRLVRGSHNNVTPLLLSAVVGTAPLPPAAMATNAAGNIWMRRQCRNAPMEFIRVLGVMLRTRPSDSDCDRDRCRTAPNDYEIPEESD